MKSSSRDTHNVRRTSWRRLLPYAIPFLLGAVLSAGVGLCLWRFHYGLTDAAALSSTSESAALRGANAELETLLEAAGPEHFSRYLSPAMKELHEMVMGPDEAIDLARANLLVASEIPEFRGLDIGKALSEIDDIAQRVRQETERCRRMFDEHPERFFNRYEAYQINILGTMLRDDIKIRYKEGKLDHGDPRVLFLNGLLEQREGTCVSMPLLYLVVGLRLGYPLHGVVVADHTFCRWDDGKYRQNIEATGAGFGGPDKEYLRDMGATDEQVRQSIWMKNLTRKQMIGQFLFNRATYWAEKSRLVRAQVDLTRALKTSGNDPYITIFLTNVDRLAARGLPQAKTREPPLVYRNEGARSMVPGVPPVPLPAVPGAQRLGPAAMPTTPPPPPVNRQPVVAPRQPSR
jgi:regulator of sirC expression with transglutaminase-like and TPR domain